MKIILFPFAKKMRVDKPHPKNYPHWVELVKLLNADGHQLLQLGVEGEDQLVENFKKNLSYDVLCEEVKACDTWIGVDSFGQHLAWSLDKRGIALFGQSDPIIFGHEENVNLLKDRSYLREQQFWLWEQAEYNPDSFVTPDVVIKALNENFVNK